MLTALIRFWPILVPLIIFIVWYINARHNLDIKVIDQFRERRAKYLMYALISSAVIAIICSAVYVLSRQDNTHQEYVPARVENGQLIPSSFRERPQNNE
jgi:hypothetical protein